MDLFRLQIDGADTLFPELASRSNWVPLEFRYFDRINSSSPEGAIAYFPDVSTTIEAYLCSAPTVKVLTITQPRFQCTSRNSSAIVTFDSVFFSQYLKFGTKFSFSVAQESPMGQRAKVYIGESLSIQLVDLTPPMPTDPYFDNVTLLMHMEGSDGGTVFTDSSPLNLPVVPFANAKTSTTAPKIGSSSAVFDGFGDRLTVLHPEPPFGDGDFTLEFFLKVQSVGVAKGIIGATTPQYFAAVLGGSGKLYITAPTGGVLLSPVLTVGVWYHFAFTREGGTGRLFMNGILQASGSGFASNITNTTTYIGSYSTTASDSVNGYIDEVRITKGVARYTADFTPPIAPFPDSGP